MPNFAQENSDTVEYNEGLGAYYVVAQNGLVLRDKPSRNGKKIATMPYNAEVEILDENGPEETIGGKKAKWYKVKYKKYVGWAFGAYIELID